MSSSGHFCDGCIKSVSETIPESFEVLLYFLQSLVEAAGEAANDEESAVLYMDMVEDLANNKVRLFGVLSIVASVLYKINETVGFQLSVGSTHPEEYETMLVNWVSAVKALDQEKISDLTTGIAQCNNDFIEGFLILLISFYITLVIDS